MGMQVKSLTLMLFFAHIFAGTVLGLLLARIIGDSRIILVCITGSILPDLIDKPLGLILFPQTLDNARTFGHTLLFVGIIIVLALIALRSRNAPLIIFGLAGAVLLHQILDEMWHEPVTWFYPLGGMFQPHPEVNFLCKLFLAGNYITIRVDLSLFNPRAALAGVW